MQRFGGISNYFANIIFHIKKTQNVVMPRLISDNEYVNMVYDKPVVFPIKRKFKGKGRIVNWLNKRSMTNALKRQDFDIFHPTYYLDYYLDFNKKPMIITVYDMIHELYNIADFVLDNKRKLCNTASRIIAISERTKQDLIKIYGIAANKIDVVHLATNFEVYTKVDNILELPEKYILFVGNRDLYKNFTWTVKALAPVLKQKQLKLLCIGSQFNNEEKRQH